MPPKLVLDKVRLRKKVANVVRQGLGPYCKQNFFEEMNVRPLSFVIDKTTDVGTVIQLTIFFSSFNNEMVTDINVIDFVGCSNRSVVFHFHQTGGNFEVLKSK